jgi:hypothetical protein
MYKISVGKPEEKVSLGRSKSIWEDSIRMDPKRIKCVAWIGQHTFHGLALENTEIRLRIL